MSMNATAALWYGIYGDIPDAARTEIDEPADDPYGEKVVDGVHIHMVYVYDRNLGAGATLAHNWSGDRTDVDFDRLPAVKAAADKFFDEYEVPGERGWHLTANYS